MTHLWRAKQLAKYISKAKNLHGIHSPFVYELLDSVIYNKTNFSEYQTVETIRKQLLSRTDEIEITDLGAGSTVNKSNKRKVADIAKNSAKGGKWGELLFRLARRFEPEMMIELGTSLGIGSLYQSLGNPHGKLTTFEGCPNTAEIAQEQFNTAQVNPSIIKGNFDYTLQPYLDSIEKLAFLDVRLQNIQEPIRKKHSYVLGPLGEAVWGQHKINDWTEFQARSSDRLTSNPRRQAPV